MTDLRDNTVADSTPLDNSPSRTSEFDINQLKIRRSGAGRDARTSAQADSHKTQRAQLLSLLVKYRWNVIPALFALLLIPLALLMRPSAVQVATVTMAYPSQQFILLNATGYVVPQMKAAVASKATGRLEWLGVSEGSHVKKDQVLARLESRDVQSQFENAQANVRVARAAVEIAQAEAVNATTTANRFVDLKNKNYVSQSMVDDALARSRKAKANLEGAQASLGAAQAAADHAQIAVDYTGIRAPFDGVILSKTANIGDVVTPLSAAAESKGAVVTMADLSTLQVEADVSEASLAKVRIDQPCEIVLDSIPNARFRGVVRTIVPTIDRTKATITTKIGFLDSDPRILPEMSARVSFLSRTLDDVEQKPITAIDPGAIVKRGDKQVAFAVWKSEAIEVEVIPGEVLGDLVSIRSILKAGDIVVKNPGSGLRNGSKIKIDNNNG